MLNSVLISLTSHRNNGDELEIAVEISTHTDNYRAGMSCCRLVKLHCEHWIQKTERVYVHMEINMRNNADLSR